MRFTRFYTPGLYKLPPGLFYTLKTKKCKNIVQNLRMCFFLRNFAAAKLNFFCIMDFESIKNELRDIVNTPARDLTIEQKKRVQEIAADLGLEFERPKKGCGSCYHDAAMKCYNRATEMQAAENDTDDDLRYILKPGVDVYFGNIRVNETTITDELAEAILARGFERKNFVKICE